MIVQSVRAGSGKSSEHCSFYFYPTYVFLFCKEGIMVHEFIDSVETWNSGGNVMLDIIKLKSGQILIISDEVVCKYESIAEFEGDEGEHDYDKHCIELFDPREQANIIATQSIPTKIIGKAFEFGGTEITNPFLSECGRFDVDPHEYYGEAYKKSLED